MSTGPARSALVIGCGYVGLPVAQELIRAGWSVAGWVRSEAGAQAARAVGLTELVIGSVAQPELWSGRAERFELIIHAASSSGGDAAVYREVFLEGAEQMVTHGAAAQKVMISSTSVYGQQNGEWVDESSEAQPATATGKILRAAEERLLGAGATIVRSAGIYGPGRAVLVEKLRRGVAVREGDGRRWMNQIHRDDLVRALLHFAAHPEPGLFNAADNEPVAVDAYYAWTSAFLGVPFPPAGPANPNRKRGLTNKRVANGKLRALGWAPDYPSFREGLTADHSPR